MKILLQDRQKIIEMPRELWITLYDGENYGILGNPYITPVLGLYKAETRAQEVLQEIFESYQSGKSSYIMPEQ